MAKGPVPFGQCAPKGRNTVACPQLPKRVLYALKCLCCLAGTQQPMRAKELAHCTGIPLAEAAKVLYLLTWGGFVLSRRGSNGGYWLGIPPEKIRLGEVVRFFQTPADRSSGSINDPVLRLWIGAIAPSYDAFEDLTLADLARNGKASNTPEGAENSKDDLPFVA